ncbi:MAG: hypothetical protein K9I99_18160 [Melioribacteraceae bacterium]|nr:hypothetical protein [Melioribacteraceae bacterium]
MKIMLQKYNMVKEFGFLALSRRLSRFSKKNQKTCHPELACLPVVRVAELKNSVH